MACIKKVDLEGTKDLGVRGAKIRPKGWPQLSLKAYMYTYIYIYAGELLACLLAFSRVIRLSTVLSKSHFYSSQKQIES